MQKTSETSKPTLEAVPSDNSSLTHPLESRPQSTVDSNPLCRGCESKRRSIALLAGTAWFAYVLFLVHTVLVERNLTGQTTVFHFLVEGLKHGKPQLRVFVFSGLLGPYLIVLAHWNCLLWRHGQPCLPKRAWQAGRGLWSRVIRRRP